MIEHRSRNGRFWRGTRRMIQHAGDGEGESEE